jgi:hypothetical protein
MATAKKIFLRDMEYSFVRLVSMGGSITENERGSIATALSKTPAGCGDQQEIA